MNLNLVVDLRLAMFSSVSYELWMFLKFWVGELIIRVAYEINSFPPIFYVMVWISKFELGCVHLNGEAVKLRD